MLNIMAVFKSPKKELQLINIKPYFKEKIRFKSKNRKIENRFA